MVLPSRRTHGVYRTEDEAKAGAHNLVRLLNGVPYGYVMALGRRMGAFVLFSCSIADFNRAYGPRP